MTEDLWTGDVSEAEEGHMATAQAQKMKLLYLMRILLERTDEDHMLTANELCGILRAEYDVPAERKSI